VLEAEARAFVEHVAALEFGSCFRPLSDEHPELDQPGAAAVRRANLARYLVTRTRERPVVLAGEAMGYAGGRFSGIAFTAERTLIEWGAPYALTSTRPEGWKEMSGSIVHGLLGELGLEQRVLLWNTVPAHPHPDGRPLGNRAPSMPERRAGGAVLGALLELVRPLAVVPVGKIAERSLAELGFASLPSVRHPAQGGATRFRSETRAALDELGLTRDAPERISC
jgi:Uracil DNA glycosylase superfamily